jgi:hypothetical protein
VMVVGRVMETMVVPICTQEVEIVDVFVAHLSACASAAAGDASDGGGQSDGNDGRASMYVRSGNC